MRWWMSRKKILILRMQQWADLAIFISSPISKIIEYNWEKYQEV